MNIRRVLFFAILILSFPLPSWTQADYTWGRPSGVRSAELFSTGELKTMVLLLLAATFMLGCLFLVSSLLSAWEVSHGQDDDGFSRRTARAPDLNSDNPARTALVRRLPPSPVLLAARDEAEKSQDAPSRSGEETGRGSL